MFSTNSIIAVLGSDEHRRRMTSWYQHYGQKGRLFESRLIDDFLTSTVDEVRSRRANRLAQAVLDLQLLGETMAFRDLVLRREAGGDIANPSQRDHTAHTVNNWLLGWLIYEKSPLFRDAFARAAAARGLPACRGGEPVSMDIAFGDVWIYASLLHDIGYLLEGAIEAMSWRSEHELARQGIAAVRDILENQIWSAWGLSSFHNQHIAKSGVSSWFDRTRPRGDTLVSIVEELKSLGDLRPLFAELEASPQLRERRGSLGILAERHGQHIDPSKMDAFDLWRLHYSQFGSESMLHHIDNVCDSLYALAIDGLPNEGLRLIDHGVAGGLIILQINTLFFSTLRALKGMNLPGWETDVQWRTFRAEDQEPVLATEFWWCGIVWAAFSTAFHNVQQLRRSPDSALPETGRFSRVALRPLRLDEDPLSYLGILVDILQEWDRYYVVRKGHVAGKEPLQGVDVPAAVTGGKLQLDLGSRNRTVENSLSAALEGWEALVSLSRA